MSVHLTRRAALTALAVSAVLTRPGLVGAQDLPKVVVNKDPSCGCCGAWVDHIRRAGFQADVVETSGVNQIKMRLGVPPALASCHTAEVDGFVVEGHVPASALKRLLVERPADARGLAVPGMPVGSPGMEVDGVEPDEYDVVLFGQGGQRRFARFRGGRELVA
jgi:hypothetical protein